WAADPARRKKAGVPEEVTFRTKPEIALDQIRAALEAGAPPGVVLMDAGYGALVLLAFAYLEGDALLLIVVVGLSFALLIAAMAALWGMVAAAIWIAK